MEFVLQSYVKEIKGTPVRANIVDPGRIRTTMRADAYPGEDPKTLPEPSCITSTLSGLPCLDAWTRRALYRRDRRTGRLKRVTKTAGKSCAKRLPTIPG